jgi:phosphoenolpyruvate---glycerone phosphotransferase subunit DhaL
MEKLGLSNFREMIKKINETLQENKMFLSQLDSVIGDGDHGTSISKGFLNAVEKIEQQQPANISDLLKLTGNSIAVIIGGVTGPVFGTFFSEMGRTLPAEKDSVDIKDLSEMFVGALEKIMKIGGAKPGDKTMVDALFPAVQALKEYSLKSSSLKGAFSLMVSAAKKGAESTGNMVAAKGRARYAGERSIGYEDAGANTIHLIIKAMYESI